MHYMRWHRFGDPLGMTSRGQLKAMPVEERFWAQVDKSADCWLWTGWTRSGVYGCIQIGSKTYMAHRFAYEMAGNTLIDGMVLDHVCHTTLCVNPAHLRQVTRKENSENYSGPQRNNTSGYLGVSWHKHRGRWVVNVTHDGERYCGGYFTDVEEAAEAARQLRLKLFTHNDLDRTAA
jgi:hypothetical protein